MISKYTEVREVLRRLVNLGFTIDEVEVNDVDEDNLYAKNGEITPQTAYDKVNEYDEGVVWVKKNDKTYFLHFVLGNEPGVALSNYTVNDEIEKVADEVCELYQSEGAYNQLVELQDEVEKCKQKILSETECFEAGDNNLFEMVCILISQRDNAYNEADHYKQQVSKYKNIV